VLFVVPSMHEVSEFVSEGIFDVRVILRTRYHSRRNVGVNELTCSVDAEVVINLLTHTGPGIDVNAALVRPARSPARRSLTQVPDEDDGAWDEA
jgi:hypothetical protein